MLPQLIYLALTFFGLGISLAIHGKPRSNENFVVTLISTIIGVGLVYWGGFFDPLIAAFAK